MDKIIQLKLNGDMINVSFSAFKDALPLITRFKKKTDFNEIILGKWQQNKKK